MHRTRRASGFTLIEVLIAMFVLVVGATGAMGIYAQGQRLHGDSLRATRAAAIAADLLASIEQWPYASASLANRTTANDADLGDSAAAYEDSADPVADNLADYGEADLPPTFAGVPNGALGTDYQRFWSVAPQATASGTGVDALRIAVVVRWPSGTRWHRVVLYAVKPNPATVH